MFPDPKVMKAFPVHNDFTVPVLNNDVNWTGVGSSFMQSPNSIAWNGNRRNNYITFSKYIILALGQGINTIAYSDDFGVSFTGLGSTIFSSSGNVLLCYKNQWIAGGSGGTNVLAYSENSKDWFISTNQNIFSAVHGFVISTKNNSDIILAVGEGDNKIAYSHDGGKSWQLFSAGTVFFDTACYDIATHGTQLVAVGVNTTTGNVASSTDGGKTWTFYANSVDISANTVLWDGTKWWVGGEGASTSLSYSFDGIFWISSSLTTLNVINDIDSNGIMVAVGSGASHSIITSSTSGLSWVGRGKTIFDIGKSVQWNGKFWVALGSSVSNSIAYSTTGIVWTPCINSLTVFSTSGNAVFSNYNNNTFMTMNEHPVILLGTGDSSIAYCDNSMGLFTGLGTSTFTTGNRGIYNGSLYVVMGAGLTNTVAISYTGHEWIGLGVTIFSTSGKDICYFNNRFVATGEGGNTFATSYDGFVWVGSGITMFLYGTAIANNDNVIVACGIGDYDNMAYSTDAVNWT